MSNNATKLKNTFHRVQKRLQSELDDATDSTDHCPTKGAVHEEEWKALLGSYLPKRYAVESGFIIDSNGNESEQIDLVIFDPQYTPLLLVRKSLRYIPIEAVYAVFECKSKIGSEELSYAGKKAQSVRALHRTSVAIAYAGGTYPAKKCFPIVAGILAPCSQWTTGLQSDAFIKNLPTTPGEQLDCGCALNDGSFNTYHNEIKIDCHDGALMTFLFDLLAKLQSLGTVPAIDWHAYANIMRTKTNTL